MPTCPACGASNADEAAYCRECGTELSGSVDRPGGSGEQEPGNAGSPTDQAPSSGTSAGRAAPQDAGLFAGISVFRAASVGARAFLGGYLLVAVAQVIDAVILLQRLGISVDDLVQAYTRGAGGGSDAAAGETLVLLGKVIGWIFFNAHQVPIVNSSGNGGSVNMLAQMGQTSMNPIPPIVYYAIPPVVLAIGGYTVARSVETPTAVSGAKPGAAVAIGYIPMALIGAFLVRISVSGFQASGWVGPALGTAVVLTGVWAVVCGGVGGVVAGAWGSRDSVG